jgi:ligand-binding sensor domain-containing protein/signal transduction histidine kinase
MRFRDLPGVLLPVLLAVMAAPRIRGGSVTNTSATYDYQTWRTEAGLPQNSVHSVVQTTDGYLWLATESGLARFDGYRFVVFDTDNTPELHSNEIRRLLETRDGALWIATPQGLTRLQNGRFRLFTRANGLPSNNILSLFEDRSRMYAVTTEGTAVYQNGAFAQESGSAYGGKVLTAAAADNKGCLWTGTESGLSLQCPPKVQAAELPRALSHANVTALLVDKHGRVWIGTDHGLSVEQQGRFRTIRLKPPLESDRVMALLEDRAGAIWAGTEQGAVRISGDDVEPVRSPESVSEDAVLSLFQDRDGDIWIGTDTAGVTVLRRKKFTTYGRNEGVPDVLVRCLAGDARGDLWAGTNGEGLRRFDGQKFTPFTTADGLSSDVILSIACNRQGEVLAGTPDGLDIVRHDHVRWLTSADGLPDDFVRSIYEDLDGSLWLGTRRGLAHYAHGAFTTYTVSDGLPSDLVGAILRGRDGSLWIGTLKGLACMRGGKFMRSPALASTRGNPIMSLFQDDSGTLWIGTDGAGLMRLEGGNAFAYPRTLGLPNTVSGIVQDENGNLWLASPRGLFRVPLAELDAYQAGKRTIISVVCYGTADGLPVNDFSTGGHPTVWRDQKGTIWFATAKGIISLDGMRTGPELAPPSVVIEGVDADGRMLLPAQASAFGPSLSRISFEYTGISLAAPQQVRFKYRLEGFDDGWVDAGTRRTAYYTNLPPGSYRFLVLARNADGLWNQQGASLAFRLRPHFYQTNPFRVLLVAAFLLLAYGIYRRRVMYVRRQFDAILGERNRIAREIHDTLAQGYVAVSVQLELIRQLMSTSAEAAGDALLRTQALVQDNLAEARRSIWNLRSDQAEDALPSKLSKTVRRAVQNHPLQVNIEITGAYRRLPDKIEAEVLRIGQEAVTNAVRHAKARRLDVKLAFERSAAYMTVSDDGQGFSGDYAGVTADGHFGIRGMHERAEGINAKLSVITGQGKGTRVCLEVPLK